MKNENYIVILCFNKFNLTETLLNSLLRYEGDHIDKVIVVDNGSTDPETEKGLLFWTESQLIPIEVLLLKENIGFTLGANTGLKLATGEPAEHRAIFLISNDVKIHGKFIEQACDLLFGARRYLVGNRHIVFDSGWNTFGGKVFDYLEGYFLAATSDGWRDLGYFDERYAPFDMEDVDLSTTAKTKGYKLA